MPLFSVRHDHYFHFEDGSSALIPHLEAIMATQEQLAAQLTALRDSLNTGFATITGKLSEASTEIPAKIQELLAAIGPVAPEVQAIADELSSMVSTFVGTITEQADGLANIVSDAPPTE